MKAGLRLKSLATIPLLNYIYAGLVEGLNFEQRLKLNAGLLGKLGPNGGWIVDDPDMPAEMQGQEAPDWWDPFESYSMGTSKGVVRTTSP